MKEAGSVNYELSQILSRARNYDEEQLFDAMKFIHAQMKYRKHIAEKVNDGTHGASADAVIELFEHTKDDICKILGIYLTQ